MADHKSVQKAVFNAIDKVNELLPAAKKLNKSADELIIAENSKLDSLGLINFLVGCEQQIENEIGAKIILLDGSVFDNDSYRNVEALINFISIQLKRDKDE